MKIQYFARHDKLDVAAGFVTKERRDSYIAVSIDNGHPWRICDEEEAQSCACYQNIYENDKDPFTIIFLT